MLIPWFQFTTIHLGPIPIQVWGLFVALGMILSLGIIYYRARDKGVDPEILLDLALWAIVGGLLGARVFHVFFYEPSFFLAHPIEIVKVWNGGLSSFGGLFGAVVGFLLCVKKYRGVDKQTHFSLVSSADILSFAAVYGWMVGRIGCFMIHDHLGVHSYCPFAILTPGGAGPRLDMALLEIIGMIPLGILFFVMRKKAKPPGWFMFVLFVYYGLLRFVLDFARARDIAGADVRYLGLTPGQYFAILLVIFGVYFLRKHLFSQSKK